MAEEKQEEQINAGGAVEAVPEDDSDLNDLLVTEEKDEREPDKTNLKSAMDKLTSNNKNGDLVSFLPGAKRTISVFELLLAYVSLFVLNKPKIAGGIVVSTLLTLIIVVNLTLSNAPDASPGSIIEHDYSKVQSKYELNAGKIDHWCLQGGDAQCRCEDPLHAYPKKNFPAWQRAFEKNVAMVNKLVEDEEEVDVAFLGENIVENWGGSALSFNSTFVKDVKSRFDPLFNKTHFDAKYLGIPLGIVGDSVSNVLYRIQNGEMPEEFNPKIWWIVLGTNDLALRQCSEEVVLLGILRIIEEILEKKPDTRIVVNSILPLSSDTKGRVPRIAKTDRKKVGMGSIEHGLDTDRRHRSLGLFRRRKNKNKIPVVKKKRGPLRWVKVSMWPSVEALNYALKNFCDKHERVQFFDSYDIFVDEEDPNSMPTIVKDYVKSFATGQPTVSGHAELLKAIQKQIKSMFYKEEKKKKKSVGEGSGAGHDNIIKKRENEAEDKDDEDEKDEEERQDEKEEEEEEEKEEEEEEEEEEEDKEKDDENDDEDADEDE